MNWRYCFGDFGAGGEGRGGSLASASICGEKVGLFIVADAAPQIDDRGDEAHLRNWRFVGKAAVDLSHRVRA